MFDFCQQVLNQLLICYWRRQSSSLSFIYVYVCVHNISAFGWLIPYQLILCKDCPSTAGYQINWSRLSHLDCVNVYPRKRPVHFSREKIEVGDYFSPSCICLLVCFLFRMGSVPACLGNPGYPLSACAASDDPRDYKGVCFQAISMPLAVNLCRITHLYLRTLVCLFV